MKLLLSLAILLLAAATLPAQEEEGTTLPPAQVAASTPPAPVAPVLDPNELIGPLILPPNNPNNLDTILGYYEKISGKILLRDGGIGAQANPLSLVINRQLPRVEMLRLIESFLLLNGYAIVPSGENAVKVLNTQGGKNPLQEGTRLYTNIDDIPKGDEVISFFLPFKYLSSDDANTVIQSYWAPHATLGGKVVPVKSAQAVILVEGANVIREIVKLQELIDVPPSRMKSGFVELKRADAETVVELVTKLLDARKQQQSSSGQSGTVRPGGVRQANAGNIQRPNQPVNPNQPAQQGGGGDQGDAAISYNDVQLVADTRTNRVLIEAMPASYDYIRKLVEEFDAAIILNEPVIIPLNFVKANDILPVLQTLLTENKKDAGAAPGGNQAANSTNRQTTNRSTGGGGGGSSSSSGGDSESPDALDAPAEETPPEAVVIGNIRLIGDQKTNSIVVIGAEEAVEKIRNVIATLDKRPQQVYLATVIGELRLTDDFKWSIDYVQKLTKTGDFGHGSSLNTTSDVAKSMSPSVSALNTLGFAAVPGLGYYLTISNTLQAMVQLLEGTKMFRVLSRPSVYTANNKKAVIRSGREVAVPSSTVSNLNAGTNDNAAVTSNIDFKTIELKLEVVPLINANRQVTLEIAQKNDSQVGTTNITGIEVPEIQTQRVNTTVTVNDQSTVVLGGLITDDTRITEQGIPWVSQIPLIGYLFKSEDRTKERRELVVMIQPTVIAETDDASKESDAEAAKYDVAPGSRHILEEGTTENKLRGEKMLKDREKKLNLDKAKEDKDGNPAPKAAPISETDAGKITLPPVKGS